MRLVVDTNIVISAIINDKGKIGELLLNKPIDVHFFSPGFLLEELNIHTKKILNITGYSESEFQQIQLLVTNNIEFIDAGEIKKRKLGNLIRYVGRYRRKRHLIFSLEFRNRWSIMDWG